MIKIKGSSSNPREVKASLVEEISGIIPKDLKSLTVGIHEDAGAHDESDESDETVAEIGAKNHFGFISSFGFHVPPRPWLDVGVLSGAKKYAKIIKQTTDQGKDLNQSLEKVAVFATAATQNYIIKLREPPNAKETIKKKGSSNPLIDTGQMMQSVTSKISGDLEGGD